MPDTPTQAQTIFASDEPFDAHRIHALAIYCSDGRFGEQFDDFLHNHLGLPRYDRLAVPGGPACLAGRYTSENQLAGIKEQIRFLIEAHKLQHIVLIQHFGCAFYGVCLNNPDPAHMEPVQDEDLALARAEVLKINADLKVTTVYARMQDNRVSFEPVGSDD